MVKHRLAVTVFAACGGMIGSACGSSSAGGTGAAGAACYPNGTCNSGATCTNGTCIESGGSAGGTDAGGVNGGSGDGSAAAAAMPPFGSQVELVSAEPGAGCLGFSTYDIGGGLGSYVVPYSSYAEVEACGTGNGQTFTVTQPAAVPSGKPAWWTYNGGPDSFNLQTTCCTSITGGCSSGQCCLNALDGLSDCNDPGGGTDITCAILLLQRVAGSASDGPYEIVALDCDVNGAMDRACLDSSGNWGACTGSLGQQWNVMNGG